MFQEIATFVNSHHMALSALILLLAYIVIASEKISKVTVALLGASLTVVLGILSQTKDSPEGGINSDYFVNFIDFNVIFLLIAMMIIVSITTRSGIFNLLANKILKITRGHPAKTLAALGIFTGVTSAFLDNVTTVILLLPITFAIAKKLEISPIPFLIAEVFASNIGGTATLIGDPPNIIIGSAANFSFMDFVKELTGIVAVILLSTISILLFLFRRELRTSTEKMEAAAKLAETKVDVNMPVLIRSATVLSLVILGFILKDFIGLETSVVAVCGASVLLLFEKPDDIIKDVEWNTIFFFMGLFIIIGGLEASGGIKLMAQGITEITGGSRPAASLLILWASGFISGVIDNIPYTATMAPMILEIQKATSPEYAYPLWWCLSLGACLGGNMTIIGAAANVIVSERAAKDGYPIEFMKFFKYGLATMVLSLSISTAYVCLRFLF